MAPQPAPTLLRRLVDEAHQTYASFVRDYQEAARKVADARGDRSIATATVAEITFRRWMRGKVQTLPQQPAPWILEHMYGFPARALFEPAPEDATLALPAIEESELAMTARDAAAHAEDAASLTVPDITLDRLRDSILDIVRTYTSTSPPEVYHKAKDLLLDTQEKLDRTQVPRQREDLYLTAGQAAAVLSSVCFDLGALQPAVQHSRTAILYGQVIEHGPLQAYAHGALAFLAYWSSRPAAALNLVHTAQSFGGLGATAYSRLAAIEARTHAHLGDHEQAVRAIRESLNTPHSDRDDLHDDIGGEFGFSPERLAMSNATTYLLIGDAAGAEEAATHALHLLDQRDAGTRPLLISSQAAIDLARALLLRQELDGACEALEPVFGVPRDWRGAGVLERLAAARSQLTRPAFRNAAKAVELGERIEEFSASSVSRNLGDSAPLALEP
ncbi:hypothetical protein [Streptomyces chrestomyceticus]|uniref:hypothetical protein n=1 Tax=Streptomyces chrestomyceticus TaxID=68185 RepID=UPI0019D2715D|nr:hypothetical protein [Streptomyces chrestomyceticus]